MRAFAEVAKTALLLAMGPILICFAVAEIDLQSRLAIYAEQDRDPNMAPQLIYLIASAIVAFCVFVSGLAELARRKFFGRARLLWWQILIVGSSYPLYFTVVGLRHFMEHSQAAIVVAVVVALVNPITMYLIFRGFRRESGYA